MCHPACVTLEGMDDVAWGVLALSLTLVGGTYTYYAYHRRGLAAGLRGAALTLLPLAAYLTDTLRMFTRMADAVGDWATGLVFSPAVWLGIIVSGMSVLLFGAARVIDGRRPPQVADPSEQASGRKAASKPPRALKDSGPAADPIDDDMAEIQAILRKRGIS